MWRIPVQPIQPTERQTFTNDCISTALRLGSGTEGGDNNNEAQNSAVHLQVTTTVPVVHLSQPPQQLTQAQDATSLSTIRWNPLQTAAATRPRAPRYTASQRVGVKEQVLKAFDEAEEQYELNKRLLKALTDAHSQYSKLKRILQKGEERWMLEAHTYQSREVALLAKIGLLEDRQRQLQHQLMISQEVLKVIRMQETCALTKTEKQKEAVTGTSCPLCICPHCKRCIHDVVDLSVLSDSEDDAVKP